MGGFGITSSIAAYCMAVGLWLWVWKAQQNHYLREMRKVVDDTHTLVNSNMGVQLKLAMELSEFKAMTTNKPEDIQGAMVARHQYEEHVKKQEIVDRGQAVAS